MSDLNECDDCGRCRGCGRLWCKAWETSPGEVDDLCTECWCTEETEVEFSAWVRRGWAAS